MSAQRPRKRELDGGKSDVKRGRGLNFVELLSRDRGFYRTHAGKSVWASFVRY